MKRDFTAAAQQELLTLVGDVEREKWCDITDWIGDRFIGVRQMAGELSIDHYLMRMNQYHKLIIDKNNATESTINNIFDNVYYINNQFVGRFAACETRLNNYINLVDRMAATIDPTGTTHMVEDLSAAFDDYEQQDKALGEIATSDDGLTQDTLEAMDPGTRQTMVQRIIKNVMDSLPGLENAGTIEIPLCTGWVVYYTVKSYLKGSENPGYDVSGETKVGIDEGRARLKEFDGSWKARTPGGEFEVENHQDGTSTLTTDNGKYKSKIGTDGVAWGSKWEHDGAKYSYEYGYKTAKDELYVEESVEVKTEHGSIESTAGIRKTGQNRLRPVPVPAYDPEPVSKPRVISNKWKTFIIQNEEELKAYIATGATIIVVGGLIVAVVVTGGSGALLVPCFI